MKDACLTRACIPHTGRPAGTLLYRIDHPPEVAFSSDDGFRFFCVSQADLAGEISTWKRAEYPQSPLPLRTYETTEAITLLEVGLAATIVDLERLAARLDTSYVAAVTAYDPTRYPTFTGNNMPIVEWVLRNLRMGVYFPADHALATDEVAVGANSVRLVA